MGGASTLLMIALVGITYGWQPDQQGGVEYIIQISPTELQEIERLGGLSSTIDPEIRGHISRVIVRVGNGRLPREAPAFARNSQGRMGFDPNILSVSDHAPVSIPEIGTAGGAARFDDLAARSGRVSTSVLKPDPDDAAAGPGFSLPPTLRNNVDAAGREIVDRTSQALGNLRNTAVDALRGDSGLDSGTRFGQQQPRLDPRANLQQPSTGSNPNSAFAVPRTSGPSTEPLNRRDNTWQEDFSLPPNSAAPSTDPFGARFDATRRQADPVGFGRDQQSASGLPSSNGLRSSDTFGRTPNNMSFSGAGGGAGQSNMGYDRSQGGVFSQLEQMPPGSRTTGWPSNDPTTSAANAGIRADDYQRNLANSGSRYSASQSDFVPQQTGYGQSQDQFQQGSIGYDTNRSDPNARNQTGYGSSDARDLNGPGGYPSQDSSLTALTPNSQRGPDPRLTKAEIDAGAWSFDSLRRLVDRYGRLVSLPGDSSPDSGARYQDPRYQDPRYQDPRYQDPRYQDPRYQDPRYQDPRYQDPRTLVGPQYPRRTDVALAGVPQSGRDVFPSTGAVSGSNAAASGRNPNPIEPPSIGDRPDPGINRSVTGTESGPSGQRTPYKTIAAQPLFNGLLLISFVANIYLIFWLKNLRLQFRDLVAANRMASGSPAA